MILNYVGLKLINWQNNTFILESSDKYDSFEWENNGLKMYTFKLADSKWKLINNNKYGKCREILCPDKIIASLNEKGGTNCDKIIF